ncbi:MAG: leucine-rich repeat protein [Ruminococcus sp.]|nr:leucine-rich repeat protein [Ruminococcus sp.]
MRKIKRITSIILAALMVMSLFAAVPMTVNAVPPGESEYGEIGTGIGGSTTVITPVIAADLPESKYLTFTAEEAGSSVTLRVASGSNLLYNKNNSGWQSYTAGAQIALSNVGDYVRFRGKDTTFNYSNHVSINGKVACSGNVMSLRLDDYGESQGLSNNCFYRMFSGCTGLTAAPELPETMLAASCYNSMFSGCERLTTAPELPATTLATGCYSNMFEGCTSLTTAPKLWATTLESGCYGNMFSGCGNLTTAPKLPAKTLAKNCYRYMFDGCGRLTTAPELPATTLAENCYQSMFSGCTSLTTAPELPATTLVRNCYNRMFEDCSSIKLSETQKDEYSIPYRVPSGGNGTTADYALDNMFYGTGGTFTSGTPEINKTYYRPAEKYTVTDESVNGTVTASVNGSNVTEAAENADVTLTVAPAEGYQFKSITATCAKNGVEGFSDLVALMGDAVADGYDGDFDGYTFKVEDGKFVIYNGSTLFAELSESDVTDFQVGDETYVESGDEGWYFTLSDNKITDFYWENSLTYDYFCTNEFESTGTLPLAELALTTVTEGSQYSFTMPKNPVTVTAEFEEASAPEGINYGGDNYIDPKGTQEVSSSDEGKNKFGLNMNSYLNMQMLGIQLKNSIATEGGDDGVRFVTAVNSNLLKGDNIDDYGYIVAKIDSNVDTLCNNMGKFTAEKFIAQGAADTNIFTCKGSSNSISGEFGQFSSDTDYKYVTLAVTGTSGKSGNLVARFYVKTKDGQYHYADYISGSKQTYSGMAFDLSAVSENLG